MAKTYGLMKYRYHYQGYNYERSSYNWELGESTQHQRNQIVETIVKVKPEDAWLAEYLNNRYLTPSQDGQTEADYLQYRHWQMLGAEEERRSWKVR